MLKAFYLSLQTLTRFPIPAIEEPVDPSSRGLSVVFYPFVGLLIGVLLVVLHQLLGETSGMLQAALLLLFWLAATDGKGLAALPEMMTGNNENGKESPSAGGQAAFDGVAMSAAASLLLVKFTALSAVIGSGMWSALLLAPMLGRSGSLAAYLTLGASDPDGAEGERVEQLPLDPARLSLAGAAVLSLVFWGWSALLVLAMAAGCFVLVRSRLQAAAGGINEAASALLCELVEITVLVILALMV